MIYIILSGEDFRQEISPLVKAFYPEETLKVFFNEEDLTETSDVTIRLELLPDQFFVKLMDDPVIHKETGRLERKEYRNELARVLYDLLHEKTGKTLPWGILTGVRPVKLIYDQVKENQADVQIVQYMTDEYYCSEKKAKKGIQIAKREIEILDEIDYKNGYSLYVGIPFCPTTCAYCSFTSYPLEKHQAYVEPYLQALYNEINHAKYIIPDKKLNTIYIGGGTPTSLSERQLEELLDQICDAFPIIQAKEFCVEAGRPDTITYEKLKILKKYHVNRISINPQSMRQRTLELIGRNHTIEQIEETFYMARDAGHDNINMDLIIGLAEETPDDVAYTLERIRELNPDGLTVHTLAIKRAARLNTHKELYGRTTEHIETMYAMTEEFAEKNGYLPYYLYRQKNMAGSLENIGYSKYTKEGIYNILVMEEKQDILALGAGATSKRIYYVENNIERTENVKSLKDYIERIDEMIERKINLYE